MFHRTKSLVGLDIGSSAVKAVELEPAGSLFEVSACGTEPVPPGSIVDGAIADGTVVAGTIQRLFVRLGVRTKDVAASISGNGVIVKTVTLPRMTASELAASIYWEAEPYIPFDIQEVDLDYQILDRNETAGTTTMDVLLVAAKREKVARHAAVIAQAGLRAVIVDVDAFALQHAYEVNYDVDPASVVALLNAGASTTTINIVSGDRSVFTRDISIGGNACTQALQKELNLPYETADQLKRGVPVQGASSDDARPVLHAVGESVMQEIQKTFDFYKATAASDRIDRIVVSGGASRAERFTESLAGRLCVAVEPLDLFRRVRFDARRFDVDAADAAPALAVAVGLGLRRVGAR